MTGLQKSVIKQMLRILGDYPRFDTDKLYTLKEKSDQLYGAFRMSNHLIDYSEFPQKDVQEILDAGYQLARQE